MFLPEDALLAKFAAQPIQTQAGFVLLCSPGF